MTERPYLFDIEHKKWSVFNEDDFVLGCPYMWVQVSPKTRTISNGNHTYGWTLFELHPITNNPVATIESKVEMRLQAAKIQAHKVWRAIWGGHD